jgi:hypothetical protein
MTGAKVRRFSKVAELIDLQWDREPKEKSSDYATTVALPRTWQAARFGAPTRKAKLVTLRPGYISGEV